MFRWFVSLRCEMLEAQSVWLMFGLFVEKLKRLITSSWSQGLRLRPRRRAAPSAADARTQRRLSAADYLCVSSGVSRLRHSQHSSLCCLMTSQPHAERPGSELRPRVGQVKAQRSEVRFRGSESWDSSQIIVVIFKQRKEKVFSSACSRFVLWCQTLRHFSKVEFKTQTASCFCWSVSAGNDRQQVSFSVSWLFPTCSQIMFLIITVITIKTDLWTFFIQ